MAFACNSLVINSLRVKQGDGVWICVSNYVAVSMQIGVLNTVHAKVSGDIKRTCGILTGEDG